MGVVRVPASFVPRPYQKEVWEFIQGGGRRVLQRWHRQSGKDASDFCLLLTEAVRVPGNYFYVFPTQTEARRAVWEKIDDNGEPLLNQLPPELLIRINNQELVIETKSGANLTQKSTIRFLGMDTSPNSIRGVTARGIVFSEFAFFESLEAYKVVLPALRTCRGWLLVNSTPNGRNHMFDLEQIALDNPKAWLVSVLQTLWPDRPHFSGLISAEEMDEIKLSEGYAIEDLEREYGVSYHTEKKGAIYAEHVETARTQGRIGNYVYDPTKPVDTFWDLGKNDYTAIWFRQLVDNRIVFIDYFQDRRTNLKDYVMLLKEKGYTYGTHVLPWDSEMDHISSERDVKTQMEDLVRSFKVGGYVVSLEKPGAGGRMAGIMQVRSRFSRYCFDAEKCQEGIHALEMYYRKYDKKRQTYMDDPEKSKFCHGADALRYEATSDSKIISANFRQDDYKFNRRSDPWD